MDDLILCGKDDNGLKGLLHTVKAFSKDIDVEIDLDK